MATYYVKTTGDDGTGDGADETPWATPGYAATQMGAGDICHIKSGTYTLTTTTPGAAGPVVLPSDTLCRMEGYETTAGDLGAKPVIDVGAQTGITVFTLDGVFTAGKHQEIRNVKVDGQDGSTVVGFASTSSYGDDYFLDCETVDCPTGFKDCGAIRCKAAGGAIGFSGLVNNQDSRFIGCHATGCSSYGFDTSYRSVAVNCIASDSCNVGFRYAGLYLAFINCIAHGSTSHGFDFTYDMCTSINCLAVRNGGYGFDTIDAYHHLYNCAGYSNTSGNTAHTLATSRGFVTLSADPYDSSTPTDFRVNTTAGGGADCRGAGIATVGQTGNTDISAVQHADPAGGGGGTKLIGPGGGMIA